MILVGNVLTAGYANDPTAMQADVAFEHDDVVTLIGAVTVSYSDRRRHPVLSFEERALERFESQGQHTAEEVLQRLLDAIERCKA